MHESVLRKYNFSFRTQYDSDTSEQDIAMMEMNRTSDGLQLVFNGRQTLAEAEQTRESVMAALSMDDVRTILLDCTSIDELDISFLQLLLATRKTGQARGIAVSLTAPAADTLADTLARAGLARPGDGGKGWFDSFWAGGQG